MEKFRKYNLPESYIKFIEKMLESESSIAGMNLQKQNILDSYNRILTEVVGDKEILNYVNEGNDNS